MTNKQIKDLCQARGFNELELINVRVMAKNSCYTGYNQQLLVLYKDAAQSIIDFKRKYLGPAYDIIDISQHDTENNL